MKMLIIKSESILSQEYRKRSIKELGECIENGIMFLDPSLSYEVVEFDSLTLNNALMGHIPNKTSRRDIINKNKRLNELRK